MKRSGFLNLIIASICVLGISAVANATTANGSADIVLGQADFAHNTTNLVDGTGLDNPWGIAIDTASNRVYVTDKANNRVLWWNSITSLTGGSPADGVLGQPDLFSNKANQGGAAAANTLNNPYGVAVDTSGNVWVADHDNNRVLEYIKPTTNGPNAVLVLGQSSFGSSNNNVTQTTLYHPTAVTVDSSGKIWVADNSNNRLLRYGTLATGAAATIVLGQSNFTSGSSGAGQNNLNSPWDVKIDSAANVWVADTSNNRVLRYNAPISSGMAASMVLGQSNFSNTSQNRGGSPAQNTLNQPEGLAIDSSGRIWISDSSNYRILRYNLPISATTADGSVLLGQSSFGSGSSGSVGAKTLNLPESIALDGSGNLWVADQNNQRILEFNSPSTIYPTADFQFGQATFSRNALDFPDGKGFSLPTHSAIDKATGRIYVVDSNNNRVLWWNSPASLASCQPADGVIGQTDLNSTGSGITQSTLDDPQEVAVDASGNVWVTDYNNDRVLRFPKPSSNGVPADRVLGQTDYTFNSTGNTANTLYSPYGVAIDSSGCIWVADTDNNRVLRFTSPPEKNASADLVIGQTNFTNNSNGTTAYTLYWPTDVAFDTQGNVWVADNGNSRVLRYTSPSPTGAIANMVLGQPNYTSSSGGATSSTFNDPRKLAFDASGNIWVSDSGSSNRVLKFNSPFSIGMPASVVWGQADFTSGTTDRGTGIPCANGFDYPLGITIDSSGNFWIADQNNNRVLKFNPAAVNDPANTTTTTNVNQYVNQTISIYPQSGEIDLYIPAGTFGDTVNITITTAPVPSSNYLTIKVDHICIIITNDKNLQPRKSMTLTMHYRLSDISGLDESKLSICRYESTHDLWTPYSSSVDRTNHFIVGTIDHLSTFVLVQLVAAVNLQSVKVYPNPLNSKLNTMTISNLTANATIKIYNVSGKLIRTVPYSTGNGQAIWDGRNDGGSMVASGVYIIYINTDSGTEKIKVAVEK